jgi:hypothetical protein
MRISTLWFRGEADFAGGTATWMFKLDWKRPGLRVHVLLACVSDGWDDTSTDSGFDPGNDPGEQTKA